MGSDDPIRVLIGKARAGDREAFDRLAEASRSRLEATIRSRLGERLRGAVEVEDVLQETLLLAFRSIARFEEGGEESFPRWLGGIAEHVILKLARRRREDLVLELLPEVPDAGPSPSKGLRRQERLNRLREALSDLSEDHRQVVVLARIEGLPIKEIARRMDRSPAAVTMLLSRALRKLRASFGDTESLNLPGTGLELEGNSHGERRQS